MQTTSQNLNPSVAIILVNYNNSDDTIKCVYSIQKQSFINWFIIIVDNASLDYEKLNIFHNNDKVKLLRNEKNVGFGKANNIGAEWCKENFRASYIFILNNDTKLHIDAIKNLVNIFEKNNNKNIALIAPLILRMDNNKIWYAGGYFNKNRISVVMEGIDKDYDTNIHKEKYVQFATGCSMFFQAEEFYKLKGFDENIFIYDEDVEISIRLAKWNKKILFYPKAIVYHKVHGSLFKSKISNQLHPNHPGLLFYLTNTLNNRLYILKKHKDIFSKKNIFNFSVYLMLKDIMYLLNFKFKAVNICNKTLRLILQYFFNKTI